LTENYTYPDCIPISKNGDVNDKKFKSGAVAATLTTLDQGTDEVFAYALGKQNKWYKYHTFKIGIITSAVDYSINIKEQQKICPNCDSTVNHIVAGVQTVVGNGVAGIGAAGGSVLGPPGAVGGAVATSAVYSASDLNKQIGELVRPIAQYIVKFYYEIKNK
jgi:hypothetical protein